MNEGIKRGDIYYFDLGVGEGSVQGGIRPVIVLQNDVGNKYSPTTIVCPLTTRGNKRMLPTHVWVLAKFNPVAKDSVAMLESVTTINKNRLLNYIGKIREEDMEKINRALKVSFALS